ncbi:MAG TPA: hypothetical protein VN113_00335 [Caulobacter sp.]|nr:hypothetical protein [Caulobacter sp.]
MAYVSYRTDAVHATTTTQPQRKLAWGRLFALAAAIGLWVGIIAAVRAAI